MRDLRAVMQRWAGVVLVVVLVAVSASCGSDGGATADEEARSTSSAAAPGGGAEAAVPLPAPVQALEINATEYTFDISPDPSGGLQPGWTLLNFHNVGVEAHQVMFARIKDGVDMAELAAAGAGDSSGAGAIEFVDMIGGVSYIGPDQDTTALVNLTEGMVMAMCYVPDVHGVAHALMGMTTALTVVAPDGDAESVEPDPELAGEAVVGTIELSEDGYQLPDDLPRGWYHVRNTDSALHELSLMRLSEPVAGDEVEALVGDLAANEPPQVELEAVGGMGAISAGFDGYLFLDLAPGDYLAVDFMPDPGNPRPHLQDGYYATFRV